MFLKFQYFLKVCLLLFKWNENNDNFIMLVNYSEQKIKALHLKNKNVNYIVYDVEATCWQGNNNKQQEIIENQNKRIERLEKMMLELQQKITD